MNMPLEMVPVSCCVCHSDTATLVGSGLDFEYHTSEDMFHAYQCNECGLVYLNPRPDVSELPRIYPSSYHSLDFSDKKFGLVHQVRSRLEGARLLKYCAGLGQGARVLDVGCGDGFHLELLRLYGDRTWAIEGVDLDERAVEAAARRGAKVHKGALEELGLPADHYDLVYSIQTIEHVARPDVMCSAVFRILKPGGRFVVVTDNTGSVDFRLFRRRYWGGYHFPRHWNLFNRRSLQKLAANAGFHVGEFNTIVSPVNWVYSLHNFLVDKNAPALIVNRFTLSSTVSLGTFTLLDMALQALGRGALLNSHFVKPRGDAVSAEEHHRRGGSR